MISHRMSHGAFVLKEPGLQCERVTRYPCDLIAPRRESSGGVEQWSTLARVFGMKKNGVLSIVDGGTGGIMAGFDGGMFDLEVVPEWSVEFVFEEARVRSSSSANVSIPSIRLIVPYVSLSR